MERFIRYRCYLKVTKMKDNIIETRVIEEFKHLFPKGNALEIAEHISKIIGGLKGVRFKRDSLTLRNTLDIYTISVGGLKEKYRKKVERKLIPALAYVTLQNGGKVEAHIKKGYSTKHYAKAFRKQMTSTSL